MNYVQAKRLAWLTSKGTPNPVVVYKKTNGDVDYHDHPAMYKGQNSAYIITMFQRGTQVDLPREKKRKRPTLKGLQAIQTVIDLAKQGLI